MEWTKRRFRLAVAFLSVLAGGVVFLIGHEVFPYLSHNHDEGVYLQQASMLLHGKLWYTTDFPAAFRPWFFVQDGNRLYPKYTPVAALMYAPGVALGVPRLMLSVIAAGNVALVGLLGREAFDRPTGVLAAGIALTTPFFLIISATFMAYAPTTLLNLLFAFGYIRMFRSQSRRYAVLAGTAIGLAFFSRPYTAVLFATPFLIHAVITVGRHARERNIRTPTIEREAIVALFGVLGVGLALTYNHVVTGDALVFPYQAFAPLDGLGFGRRRILQHATVYSPDLAWRVNKHLVAELFTRWTTAAPIGATVAAIGLFPVALRYRERHTSPISDRTIRFAILGVCITVIVGNIYFWGTLNSLATIADPTDGFMAVFGPYYHFDLVLPLSVFGSAGVLWLGRSIRSALSVRLSTQSVRAVIIVLLVVSAPILAGAEYARMEEPIGKNLGGIEQQSELYAPFENESLDNALVLFPVPYGPWLSHPFQWLRNGGSLEHGDILYAQNLGPATDFGLIDAYPNRSHYRFTYRGKWPGNVTPHLQPLSIRNGTSHQLTTTVGAVGQPTAVRLAVDDDRIVRFRYPTNVTQPPANERFDVRWSVNGTHVRLETINGTPVEAETTNTSVQEPLSGQAIVPTTPDGYPSDTIAIDGPTFVQLTMTFVKPNHNTVTYRYAIGVDANNESARLLWPGSPKVCQGSRNCGHEGMYIPEGEYPDGITTNTTVQTR